MKRSSILYKRSKSYLLPNSIGYCNKVSLRCTSYNLQAGLFNTSNKRFYTTKPNILDKSNDLLRKAFDESDYWEKLNSQNYAANKKRRKKFDFNFNFNDTIDDSQITGLFNNPFLTSPEGLKKFTDHSLLKAQELAKKLVTDHSEKGLLLYINNLDLLSDTLCRVIDLCEFIRSAHPDGEYLRVAQECYEKMFGFMNMLNTDVELCYTLKFILEDEVICSKLTSEELKVGKLLLDDFEKSGIYMEPEKRKKFIELSQEISIVGQDFINHTDYVAKKSILVKTDDLNFVDFHLMTEGPLKTDISGKYSKIPMTGSLPYSFLSTCPHEELRKKIWAELHSCPEKQIKRLNRLIQLRADLAKLLNHSSYAEYQLQGKMAKNPEEVKDFLSTLLNFTKPLAVNELKEFAKIKSKDLGIPYENNTESIVKLVRPWDRNYYTRQIQETKNTDILDLQTLSSYYSLGNVIAGISDLFNNIYGIRFELEVPKVGETWLPEVRKLNVISETEGLIGIVYCDLFERSSKTANAAHFTICCSREIQDRETVETVQVGVNSNGNKFQLPIISLVCNFSPTIVTPSRDTCFLNLREIETLFHEMGHAMHSMLGRTKLQNTSGTRCAIDFVELPSILMEHFARDIRVLESFGYNHIKGEKVPHKLLKSSLTDIETLQHSELYTQAKMSMLDQVLHGDSITGNDQSVDVVKAYHDLEIKLGIFADDHSNWCGKFGHLFGYGASYYSYLFDRAIASKIWEKLFKNNPYDRVSGMKFKDAVLKWGGSKDPWKCLADALDEPKLASGDSEAIKYIGSTKVLSDSK